MRSRYSAYALQEIDYVLATQALQRPVDRRETEAWAEGIELFRLEILHTEAGGPGDEEGVVEFVAHYRERGLSRAMAERSRFGRRDGRWTYLEGAPAASKPKAGRNDPCPCGSGKKYKKCCGAAA